MEIRNNMFNGKFFVILLLLSACSPNLEKSDFNVYYYGNNSGDSELFLGVAHGLSMCQSMARNESQKKANSESWDYICCLKSTSSECVSKHR
jgi:hypothetical protein